MKARLLVGLLTVALGGLTSCSNILEENGVINNVAESGMGELRINLTTDASLNVSTKSGVTDIENTLKQVTTTDFQIVGTEEAEGAKKTFSGTANDFSVGKKVPAATYTITAEKNWDNNDQKIGFGIPHFKGKLQNIVVPNNGKSENNNISVSLVNSVITVNQEEFQKLYTEGGATITKLYVKDPDEPNNTEKYLDLLSAENTLKPLNNLDNILFVNQGVTSVSMVIEGSIPGNEQGFSQETPISISYEENKPKNYEVKYTISKDNGTVFLTITVDGSIKQTEQISQNIDPYNPNTNPEQ